MSKRIEILRVAVTAGLFAAAIICGTVSYIIVSSYERSSGTERFHNIAHYAQDTLVSDFVEKQNAILAIAKNMAYVTANESAWPNVLVPGFYDIGLAQRDSATLDDIYFLPIVAPEKLASFERFMYDYYASEPLIGNKTNTPIGDGVYGYYPNGTTYHDTTGEANWGSPHKVIAPLFQLTFTDHIHNDILARNTHSIELFGHGIDAVIDCSLVTNYTESGAQCVDVTNILYLPFFSAEADIKDIHSSILQPIYLDQNTSKLVGFIGGGFNWINIFANVFSNSEEGVEIVLRNEDNYVTFVTDDGTVKLKGLGDLHDSSYNDEVHPETFFPREDGTHAYEVYVYPTNAFYRNFQTDTPIYGAVGSAVLLGLCATTFLFYDYYMRKSKAANEAVLETKRRFVRFISHEIRTPLNAVHLGLEALVAELRRSIETGIATGTADKAMLLSWLELSTEMMSNSDNAEDVLDDLLNYDKIEMGTLYLEFSSVPIWEVVRTNVAGFQNQMTHKHIYFSLDSKWDDERTEPVDVGTYVVVGDAARLAQVIRNLLANALKFTPNHGSIAVHVERVVGGFPHPLMVLPAGSQDLLEQPRAGSVRISVTDSGPGLTEAQLAKIDADGVQFNANELQAGKGSGLGLFITKGIVEQHGGKLTVTSTGIGEGTTFAVELPLFTHQTVGIRSLAKSAATRNAEVAVRSQKGDESVSIPSARSSIISQGSAERRRTSESHLFSNSRVAPADLIFTPPVVETVAEVPSEAAVEPVQVQVPVVSSPQPQPQAKRILVVDDVMSNRKMLMRILTTKGYVCEQAEDGQNAIDVYRAAVESGQPFYAITMDFEMPVMNGPTATGHLRALGCTIPIVGVTGNMLPDDIKYFLAQGATEVLGKPLNVSKFQELMQEQEKCM